MNFLTREEIISLSKENSLISNFKDPTEIQDSEDPIIEDIKYPLRFSGQYREPTQGGGFNVSGDAEQVEIPPQDYRILTTVEEIDLFQFSSNSPIHVMAFLFLPHQFVQNGLLPTFQGIVDTGYPGKPLSIVIHNANHSRQIVIDSNQRICYIMFQYVDASAPLDTEYRTQAREPREEIHESTKPSELRERVKDIEKSVEELQDIVSEGAWGG